MNYISVVSSEDVIEHFGIKGMRWGIRSRHSNLKQLYSKMKDSSGPARVSVTYNEWGRPIYSGEYDMGHHHRYRRDRHNYKSNIYRELLKEKQQRAKQKGKTLNASTVKRLNKKIQKHDSLYKDYAKTASYYK